MTDRNEATSRWWALAAVGAVAVLLALVILLK